MRALLEAEGHTIVTDQPEVVFTDSSEYATTHAQEVPTILLATASQIPDAIRAMREGAYGYVFVPFQAGEANLMVHRALASGAGIQDETTPAARPEEMRTLAEVELEHIQTVLRRCNYNQAKAARILGIGRNTLWRKLKKARAEAAGDAP